MGKGASLTACPEVMGVGKREHSRLQDRNNRALARAWEVGVSPSFPSKVACGKSLKNDG